MNPTSKICIIGDVVVDVTLPNVNPITKLRLGGIIHSARALWALGVPYDVAYFAPAYLDAQIITYLKHHGCGTITKLGDVVGSPYVFLISEPKEIASQGYEFLLRDEIKVNYFSEEIQRIKDAEYEDYLLISGNYDLSFITDKLPNRLHIDATNNIQGIGTVSTLSRKVDTFFLSTSSTLFQQLFQNDFVGFASQFETFAHQIVLKENRGGSRGYVFFNKECFSAGAQPRQIVHSVGVGDAFDAAFIHMFNMTSERTKSLVFASWVAAEYAMTTFPDDFKISIERLVKSDVNDLVRMQGISLPWELRKAINIYIAAPDFSFINTEEIDKLADSLNYHNFSPRRPVKENGQMESGASKSVKLDLVNKDLELLEECSLLIAVLAADDPGTYIEIGYAAANGVPTIVYDPHHKASNCMLTELPDFISTDLDEVITETFVITSNLVRNGK